MSKFDHSARVAALQAQLGVSNVDVAAFGVGADLTYFTGYEASPSERMTLLVVPSVGEPALFVPQLEAPRVKPGPFQLREWGETEDPISLAGALARPKRAAVSDQLWAAFLTGLQRVWSEASWTLASAITGGLRAIKDPAEVDLLRQAAEAIDRAMADIPGRVRFAGRTEKSIARDLSELAVDNGHDESSFTIVASGANGASPHHSPGERVVEDGDLVVCDFGGRCGGYYSDSTRTFVVGDETAEQAEVHSIVLAASEAAREAVAIGVPCEELDRTAREIISEAGYGDRFIHRTGHGIGLDVHEGPYIVEGNGTRLERNMAFSIEPGIYIPDRFGIRIEDIVVCGDDGGDVLNRSDRSLVSVI